ncbi:MAG: GNAT family N-acetyltransferase [Pseudomonadales bacterium]
MGFAEYLDVCVKAEIPEHVPPGRVPQTVFWVVEDDRVVGMLRMRHRLNDYLRVKGGHIGYYIRPSARGRGIATEALGQALRLLARMGERRAFLTTDPDNRGSIRVIEANGGSLAARAPDPDGLGVINQYWVSLT